jgi:hypothetical protein
MQWSPTNGLREVVVHVDVVVLEVVVHVDEDVVVLEVVVHEDEDVVILGKRAGAYGYAPQMYLGVRMCSCARGGSPLI